MAEFIALRGIAALSASRHNSLLSALRADSPNLALKVEHWYFLDASAPLDDEMGRLKELLGIP